MGRKKLVWMSVVLVVLVAGLTGVATAAEKGSKSTTLNLVAYSTPRPVLTKLIEEFRKTPAGADINIRASYGASSAQGQAVANGLPADGVILNTGNDINDLVDKGLINKNWDKQSYNGVVWNSVVVFGLRNGNPKKVKGWNDLTKSGVGVVTVNPFTGGIAKWNILAAYVAQRKLGKTEKQAIAYLQKFYRNNVVSQDSSGSNATNTFLSGKGDVLLTFESEAINGKIPFVIPRQTMLIDVYIAALEKSEHKAEWNAFSRYLKTYPAQKILAENGYRPVDKQAIAEFRKQVPGARRARRRSPTSCSEAGARSTRSGSTRTRASCSRSSSRSECPLASTVTEAPGLPAPVHAPQGESLDGSLPAGGLRHDVPARHRRAADRGDRLEVDRQRLVRLLGGRLLPAGRRGVQADAGRLDAGRADHRGVRDDHRLGPRARRRSPARASSTRSSTCRSRCRRSSPGS